MNLGFFIMGGLIFAVYIYFTIWNIFYGARKQREENYPNYYDRHGRQPTANDMDMDGMGNFSRFPVNKELENLRTKKVKKTKKSKNTKIRKEEVK